MRIFFAFVVILLLSGCSTVRIVYEHADAYLRWRAADYLELDGDEARQLDEAIAGFMSWHRANALPKYATLLDDAERRLARGLGPSDLDWGYDAVVAQARQSLRVVAEKIAPLLDRLTPAQIAHLERGFAADNRKFARENLRGSERERRKRRTERNVERLEDWVGRLSQAQIERVAQYSARAPLLDEMREREHKRLQAEIVSLIRARQAVSRLPDLAANWERAREPAYGAALQATRSEYFAMALELDKSLSPKQRERALGRLRGYADDLRQLQ